MKATKKQIVKYVNLSDVEVRALQAGRLTLLVRPMKENPHGILCRDAASPSGWSFESPSLGTQFLKCDYSPGDVLAVREAWAKVPDRYMPSGRPCISVVYRAGPSKYKSVPKWRSPATMPLDEKHIRYHLHVTEVLPPCRVSEITDEEAMACGYERYYEPVSVIAGEIQGPSEYPAVRAMQDEWNRRFGRRHPWATAWCWRARIEECNG